MHNKFRLLHFTLKRNLGDIYANLFLKTFALSLIGLFVPIYLIKEIGVSFHDVLIYLIFLFLFVFVGYFLGGLLATRIGIKKVIMLSIPFHLGYYLLLYGLQNYNISLVLIGVTFGLADGFFWFAYNTYFAKFSDRRHRGEEVDVYYVLASVIGIFGPFVGGALLTFFNSYIVFVIVLLLLVFSIFPLLNIQDKKYGNKFSIRKVFHKDNFAHAPMFFVQGTRSLVTGVFWPLFIFYILKEYFSLGLVFSVASIFSSIVIWLVGRRIDKISKKTFANFSSMIHGIISFFKIFVSNITQVYVVATLSHVTHGTTEVSVNALTFDRANKSRHVEEYFIARELMLALGRITVIVILLYTGLDMIENLKLSFLLLGGVSLIQRLL